MRVVWIIAYILFLPFLPLHWAVCRLSAKRCPECGEKWLTELVGEWDGEMWKCHRCNHAWETK